MSDEVWWAFLLGAVPTSGPRFLQSWLGVTSSLAHRRVRKKPGAPPSSTAADVRRDDAHKSWSVRFSTDKPKPEELYD